MSPTIWTRCGATAEAALGALKARPWRVVEAQHVVSTRKLVHTAGEHEVLEALIERAKPPLPAEPDFAGLHYLLATPFRYPPLPHGSRFGTRVERGIWYGAERLRTALAEASYYRLLFLEGTAAELEPLFVDLTAFRARVESRRGADLTRPPFAEHAAEISSPIAYTAAQALGRDLRRAGAEAFRYRSARDPDGGANLGVLSPRAFASPRPEGFETWYCVATRRAVELSRRDPGLPPGAPRAAHRFPRELFEVDGALPAPAV